MLCLHGIQLDYRGKEFSGPARKVRFILKKIRFLKNLALSSDSSLVFSFMNSHESTQWAAPSESNPCSAHGMESGDGGRRRMGMEGGGWYCGEWGWREEEEDGALVPPGIPMSSGWVAGTPMCSWLVSSTQGLPRAHSHLQRSSAALGACQDRAQQCLRIKTSFEGPGCRKSP